MRITCIKKDDMFMIFLNADLFGVEITVKFAVMIWKQSNRDRKGLDIYRNIIIGHAIYIVHELVSPDQGGAGPGAGGKKTSCRPSVRACIHACVLRKYCVRNFSHMFIGFFFNWASFVFIPWHEIEHVGFGFLSCCIVFVSECPFTQPVSTNSTSFT